MERGAKHRGGFHSGRETWTKRAVEVGEWLWTAAENGKEMRAKWSPELEHKLKELDDPTLVSFGSPEPVTM